ncbi:MAG: 23S rRNA (adenine(2030)-N(6))-methyltransferase RlmJ [Candidatus Accumulibacter sp.]|jgi:23S rRNA (adenine2030-N6)-methyltransferase|nr:23S rRNA (adenine(2030)-N(6))-methyltransferase RlmJ [Accumulibacter sp.]
MLSYRHAFHAGNHADVLKHLVLVQIARHLGQKEKPFLYIDTHAGAGRYALDSGHAARLKEYKNGIGRVWERGDAPDAVADYVSLARRINPDGRLKSYPGSALFALFTLRDCDRLRLYELHSGDAPRLKENTKAAGRRATVVAGDGFAGLKASLPPPTRRAFALIDPSYEEDRDYDRVVHAVKDALARFPTGVYAVWYPRLARLGSTRLPSRLKRAAAGDWLHVALDIQHPPREGMGLYGSGVFVFNPPWTLRATLAETMPWLVEALAADAGAGFTIQGTGDGRQESEV